jgi:uncharacterized protein
VLLSAKDLVEKRYMVIGTIGSFHWSAIITYRGATLRIINVRKSTSREVGVYEKIAN